MYYVYIISSLKQNWIYTGYSTNLRNRIKDHQRGKSKATKPYLPFELIFYEAYKAQADAKRREAYLKTNQGKRVLKIMLKDSLKSL